MNKELKTLSSLEKIDDFIKKTDKRFVDRVVELMQLIRSQFGFKYPVEPLVYTPNEFRRAKKINSLFIRTVLSKGVVLYEKRRYYEYRFNYSR